jgi:hypothetical protein
MAYFQTKITTLGKFGRVLEWKRWVGIFIRKLEYVFGQLLIQWQFWYILVNFIKKNLTTLVESEKNKKGF